nr:pentatricopeptide repeat-containing protein At5g16860 [Ipomoea batatas]
MYAKCKNVEIARAMFDAIDCKDRNVVTWTVIIGAYAQHGDANEALELFSVMMKDDSYSIIPNGFTISCALMACARLASLRTCTAKSGDIDKARKVFDVMTQRNTVSWTSLMTGYGMHGRGDDALQVFERMRRAELMIDGVHKNVEIGEFAAAKLSELEAENDGSYTLLSNIYANARRWKDVARIRSLMKYSGIKKRPGM